MVSIAFEQPEPAARRIPAVAVPSAAGLALVALGALLPWVTIYAGLAPIPGYRLDGGVLAGLAVAAVGMLLAADRLGGGGVLRPLAVLMAAGVTADAVFSAWQIGGYVANPGPAAALTQPANGPGALVMAGGGLLLLSAALAARPAPRPLSGDRAGRVLVAASMLLAGWIHLLLAPGHMAESTLLGAGFLGAGVAQALLAAVVLLRRADTALFAVVGLNAALLGLYAWAVVVGLPIGGAAHEAHAAAAGLQLFAGEPVDVVGGVNALAESLALVLAVRLLHDPATVDPLVGSH